jgi:hydrogenase maturation protease
MTNTKARCLILSCGNTLRSDDGIGPYLSEWARERYASDPAITVITRHQWTPDLALDLTEAETVLFIDCAIDIEPGEICFREVEPAAETELRNTHLSGAPDLLAMAQTYYAAAPRRSLLMTIGAGSMELGETFSPIVQATIPAAQAQLVLTVSALLQS